MAHLALACIAALLATCLLPFAPIARRHAGAAVYGICCFLAMLLCTLSLPAIAAPEASVSLPLGLPWPGAHLRPDPPAAVFRNWPGTPLAYPASPP